MLNCYAIGHEKQCNDLDIIVGERERERERERKKNVLFNDALNTFYLRLYCVRHMVKDHSDSEKGNPLLPHRLLLSARVLLYYGVCMYKTGCNDAFDTF